MFLRKKLLSYIEIASTLLLLNLSLPIERNIDNRKANIRKIVKVEIKIQSFKKIISRQEKDYFFS